MPIALTFSPFTLALSVAVLFVAVTLAYTLGIEEGRERFRQQMIEHAREDGVKALRFLRGHRS